MLLTILTLIGTLVPTILQNTGVIGSGTANLITSLTNPLETLIASLRAGTTKTSDGLAALAAIQGVINVLKATTALPPAVLTEIANLDADVQAALTAYAKAGTGFDASIYATPIAEV